MRSGEGPNCCIQYRDIADDDSLFLLCLWFRGSPHLPEPNAIHKPTWLLLVELIPFANITCNQHMNPNFHSTTNSLTFARIWGGIGKPTAFGGASLTIVDFDVDFTDVVPCAFRTARRGRPAASSTTCASSCHSRPHLNIEVSVLQGMHSVGHELRCSRRPTSCFIKHENVQQSNSPTTARPQSSSPKYTV